MKTEADPSGRLPTMVVGEEFRMVKKQIWQYHKEELNIMRQKKCSKKMPSRIWVVILSRCLKRSFHYPTILSYSF